MNRSVSFGRLEFNQDLVFNDQVGTKGLFQNSTFESDGNDLLSFDRKTLFFQTLEKQYFIDGFEQAWPNIPVQVKPAIHRDFGDSFKTLHKLILVPSCLRASQKPLQFRPILAHRPGLPLVQQPLQIRLLASR